MFTGMYSVQEDARPHPLTRSHTRAHTRTHIAPPPHLSRRKRRRRTTRKTGRRGQETTATRTSSGLAGARAPQLPNHPPWMTSPPPSSRPTIVQTVPSATHRWEGREQRADTRARTHRTCTHTYAHAHIHMQALGVRGGADPVSGKAAGGSGVSAGRGQGRGHDWSELGPGSALESIRNKFVTGDWSAGAGAKPGTEDDEEVGPVTHKHAVSLCLSLSLSLCLSLSLSVSLPLSLFLSLSVSRSLSLSLSFSLARAPPSLSLVL